MVTTEFQTEMDRAQDSRPIIKVEFTDISANTTDISEYYLGGAAFEQIKERAIDEISAGSFDIILANHNNYFSEYDSDSLLYETQYHGAKLTISLGFVLPDGTTEYTTQATGIIDQLITDPNESVVTLRCRDRLHRVMDFTLHLQPVAEVPVYNAGNGGDGTCSTIATKPFKTVNEVWALTCTTGGGAGVAIFDVVGDTSGDVGDATDGTEFSTGASAGGIKFTINVGTVNWNVGDIITFTTSQYPEWDGVNAAEIVWSILTGYNYDTNTEEDWSDLVMDLDSTQSSANTDIDYSSVVQAVDDLDDVTTALYLKGYVGYNESSVSFLTNLLSIFGMSIYTNGDGKVVLKTWTPLFGGTTLTAFTDALKISSLGYTRTVDEIVNYASVKYKRTDTWEFSGESVVYDGTVIDSDSSSIINYGKYSIELSYRWYTFTGSFAQNVVERIVSKYADPSLNVEFSTGLDAITIEIGDLISLTDTKYGLSTLTGEVTRVTKMFDEEPKKIGLLFRRDPVLEIDWGFLGSSSSEGDGISPQELSWDDATTSNKLFAYLSQAGGGGPDYRMF